MKNKINFWITVSVSIIGIINALLYLILSTSGVVETRAMVYVYLVAYIAISWLPFIFEQIFKHKLNLVAIIGYHLFMFLALVLGSVWLFYSLIAFYDTLLHALSGVLIALIAYSVFKCFNKNNHLSLTWLFILVFSITLASGMLWEIWEFLTDIILDGNSQIVNGLVGREAIMDTMIDICCDFGGGLVGSIIVLFIEKKNRKPITNQID